MTDKINKFKFLPRMQIHLIPKPIRNLYDFQEDSVF